jgi:hypothetical protein
MFVHDSFAPAVAHLWFKDIAPVQRSQLCFEARLVRGYTLRSAIFRAERISMTFVTWDLWQRRTGVFSANGGVTTKLRLLAIEGVQRQNTPRRYANLVARLLGKRLFH